jgi:hypothetical protein
MEGPTPQQLDRHLEDTANYVWHLGFYLRMASNNLTKLRAQKAELEQGGQDEMQRLRAENERLRIENHHLKEGGRRFLEPAEEFNRLLVTPLNCESGLIGRKKVQKPPGTTLQGRTFQQQDCVWESSLHRKSCRPPLPFHHDPTVAGNFACLQWV